MSTPMLETITDDEVRAARLADARDECDERVSVLLGWDDLTEPLERP